MDYKLSYVQCACRVHFEFEDPKYLKNRSRYEKMLLHIFVLFSNFLSFKKIWSKSVHWVLSYADCTYSAFWRSNIAIISKTNENSRKCYSNITLKIRVLFLFSNFLSFKKIWSKSVHYKLSYISKTFKIAIGPPKNAYISKTT